MGTKQGLVSCRAYRLINQYNEKINQGQKIIAKPRYAGDDGSGGDGDSGGAGNFWVGIAGFAVNGGDGGGEEKNYLLVIVLGSGSAWLWVNLKPPRVNS